MPAMNDDYRSGMLRIPLLIGVVPEASPAATAENRVSCRRYSGLARHYGAGSRPAASRRAASLMSRRTNA